MVLPRDRQSLIDYYRRQYKRHLKDLQLTIESEFAGVDDPEFMPLSSTALQTALTNVVVAGERLKALMEIEE